jgi:hypothetical protein
MTSDQREERKQQEERIQNILNRIEANFEKNIEKVSVSDFIRLLQFRNELREEEKPKEIKITWVEPTERSEIEE